MKPEALAKVLRNIGPVCSKHLVQAGLDTPEKLKKIGTEEAYLQLIGKGGLKCCFNSAYLYALEGAITDTDWKAIPESRKMELKQFMSDLKQSL